MAMEEQLVVMLADAEDDRLAAAQEEVTEMIPFALANESDREAWRSTLRRNEKPSQEEVELDALRDVHEIEGNARTLRAAFAAFDADGDGKLTEEEVVAALTRETERATELSEAAARALCRRWQAALDLNKDGKISIEELNKTLRID